VFVGPLRPADEGREFLRILFRTSTLQQVLSVGTHQMQPTWWLSMLAVPMPTFPYTNWCHLSPVSDYKHINMSMGVGQSLVPPQWLVVSNETLTCVVITHPWTLGPAFLCFSFERHQSNVRLAGTNGWIPPSKRPSGQSVLSLTQSLFLSLKPASRRKMKNYSTSPSLCLCSGVQLLP
jgi:hypothetical protein